MIYISQVSNMVRDQLVERARDFDIILEDVAITDLSFSAQYTNAIEAKQIGEYFKEENMDRELLWFVSFFNFLLFLMENNFSYKGLK